MEGILIFSLIFFLISIYLFDRNIIQIASLICNDDILSYLIESKFLEINQNKYLNNLLTNQNINEINLEYIDDFGATIFHYLGARGRIDLLKLLESKLDKLDKKIFLKEDKAGLTCFDRASTNCSNIETIQFLIGKSQIEMDYSNSKIKSMINWAFYNCSIKIVSWLFLNVKSIPKDILNKYSLLHEVKLETDDSTVQSFIEYFLKDSNLLNLKIDRIDINSRNSGGNTLMMELAGGYFRALSINLADFLIKIGTDLKIKNYQNQNIIHIAASAGNLELIEYLKNYKESSGGWTDIDKFGNTALIMAVENGYFNVVKYLVLNNSNSISLEKTNIYGFNALDVALSKGYHDISRFLSGFFLISNIPRLISNLNKFFESFSCKNFLLHPLVIKTSEELKNRIFIVRGKDQGKAAWHYVDVEPWSIDELKSQPHGSNIDVTNFGKILTSGWGDNPSKEAKLDVELIEEQRVYFHKFKNSILKNNIYMIERSGLNDYKDYYGANLMHISAAYGRLDLILWLYFKKFDIKTTDDCGNTALFYAALNHQYDAVVLLKLLGLNKLYFGKCRFLSGHIEKYLIKTNLNFHPNTLVASLLDGIKVANKIIVQTEEVEIVEKVFRDYFEKFSENPHFELIFRSNLR
jgi:ankyrin repeat protein